MADYSIELSFNNREVVFQIPVLPEEIEIKGEGQGEEHNVAGLGQIHTIEAPKLKEITFSGVFPADMENAIQSKGFDAPADYIRHIEDWMTKKKPIRFIFISQGLKINIPVSIEQFDYKEVGGTPGDFDYTLSVKEYVFYSAKKVVFAKAASSGKKQAAASKPKRPDERAKPKTVKVKSGDSLWSIAKANLGDGSRYKEIMKLNNITEAQAKKLKVGTVIKLPG
ncbi:LysM peptidoglycan-binding domain-containing protein [Paenibacillus solani]|uniref:LysM peptidoglycan-binding domain-containing protein n=1 Tax=Paenibacillus solani TaxID=1705565 RepID=UPI003D26CE29